MLKREKSLLEVVLCVEECAKRSADSRTDSMTLSRQLRSQLCGQLRAEPCSQLCGELSSQWLCIQQEADRFRRLRNPLCKLELEKYGFRKKVSTCAGHAFIEEK